METLGRKFTVKCQFVSGKNPNDAEMVKFALEAGLISSEIHTLYKDLNARCIFIKFYEHGNMKAFLDRFSPEMEFKYDNGERTTIEITDATVEFKYIRIFSLPPEIEDEHIKEVFKQYGHIRACVREKLPLSLGMPVFSGVRGVHIEMTKEIPNFVYVMNFKARTFYNGQKEVCFYCGSTEHKKLFCTARTKQNLPADVSNANSYRNVVLSGTNINESTIAQIHRESDLTVMETSDEFQLNSIQSTAKKTQQNETVDEKLERNSQLNIMLDTSKNIEKRRNAILDPESPIDEEDPLAKMSMAEYTLARASAANAAKKLKQKR